MPKLYIMVGVPGSGKSTWARANLQNVNIVSRDEVRFNVINCDPNQKISERAYFSKEKQVYSRFIAEIADSLNKGLDTCADATHITIGSRKKLFSALYDKVNVDFTITVIQMKTSIEQCIEQNSLRHGVARVPNETIRIMTARFEQVSISEDPHINHIVNIYEDNNNE